METSTEKTIQLFETFNVRFGVMIVGFTMGGKTCLYRMLAKALTKLRATCRLISTLHQILNHSFQL